MRIGSEFWVTALIRRAFAEGAAAAVVHRGDASAGAIFVVVDRLDGTADLHAPAPQTDAASDDGSRRFETILAGMPRAEVMARIASERRFDPDLWVVEIEDRAGRSFIEPPPVDPKAPPRSLPQWPPRP